MYFEASCMVRGSRITLSLDYDNATYVVWRSTGEGYMWSYYKCRDAAHARRVFLSYKHGE